MQTRCAWSSCKHQTPRLTQRRSRRARRSGLIRVWQATYAGDNTGSVVVSVEYPNLEALAKDFGLMRNDADLRAWLQGLAKIRKVVSDSIYEELKP
jgi:hypothetical protein